jgi:hypothetical protein
MVLGIDKLLRRRNFAKGDWSAIGDHGRYKIYSITGEPSRLRTN